MSKMIKRIAIFICCFSVIFLITESVFFKQPKEHMWEYIYSDEEDPEIDILFLGSSLFFRSIDASLINESTGLKTGVLGCGSMNLKIARNDLTNALKHKSVKVLAIDSNIVLSDWNYPRRQYGVLMLHNDSIPDYTDRLKANWYEFPIGEFPAAMFQLCRPTLTWERYKKKPGILNEDWGYKPLYEMNQDLIEMNFTPAMMQELCSSENAEIHLEKEKAEIIRELITLAKENGCKVWVLGMPRLDKAYIEEAYGTVQSVFRMAESYHADKCIEFNHSLTDMNMEMTDFYDRIHLNVNGSRKFTQYLIENYVEPEFSVTASYPVNAIKNESCIQEGKEYKYELETYGSCLFKFVYYKDNQIEKEQEFSDTNFMLLPNELGQNEKLYYEIKSDENDAVCKKGWFMKVVP